MVYPRHYTIDHYLNKVRTHTEPYSAEVLGRQILVFPNVMSPKYDRSSRMMILMMPPQNDRDVLEVGSGTGIISLFVADDAKSVLALDINEHAVANTNANFLRYNAKAKVLLSDLFEKISGQFDTIIFNAPFHGNMPNDILELGTSDYNYQTLTRFFQEASSFLKQNGEILLGFSDTGDNNLLKSLIEKNNFFVVELKTQENGDWTMYLYRIKKK
jgi:release factor glutamine methyltransferase